MDEFAIIHEYFAQQPIQRGDVIVGIGDDAAVVTPQLGKNLVCTTDMLLDGVHFPEATDPYAIGHKALAVNLSDLAAMGAQPAWVTMLLSLPAADTAWVDAFSAGFHELARLHDVQLIGGDLVRGPIAVGVQAMGYVDPGHEIRRSGARVGDDVYVSGYLGDACLGLKAVQGEVSLTDEERKQVIHQLQYPSPRVALGRSIADIAHAAIDISDGLYKDLGHIAVASGVGAHIDLDSIPISNTYLKHMPQLGWEPALCGGDDYELCLVIPNGQDEQVAAIARQVKVPIRKIGRIQSGAGVTATRGGVEFIPQHTGHDHFAQSVFD